MCSKLNLHVCFEESCHPSVELQFGTLMEKDFGIEISYKAQFVNHFYGLFRLLKLNERISNEFDMR